MASMWRRAMVYLGLQDDDELEYGGEYESYGEYADAAEEPQNARARRDPGHDDADGRGVPPRDSGTVRTRPETRRPNQFITKTRPTIPRNVSSTVRRPPPTTSAT